MPEDFQVIGKRLTSADLNLQHQVGEKHFLSIKMQMILFSNFFEAVDANK